jgi:hypothetical protein
MILVEVYAQPVLTCTTNSTDDARDVKDSRYYPYGATRGPDAVDTPYPYTGRRHEPDLGL